MTLIQIVGIGDDGPTGLSAKRVAAVDAAEMLVGGKRHLAFFPTSRAERIEIGSNLQDVVVKIDQAASAGRAVVVLASGDPLFYGIGGYLVGKLGSNRVIVHPHVSAMQLAFARIGEPWNMAALVSLHAKPIEDLNPALERLASPIGLFTDEQNTPNAVARYVLALGGEYLCAVCENLDADAERVWTGTLEQMAEKPFGPLNVVILRRRI
ncbi:MAG: precorrin-6y C5,15-methyltransferase (decarboxylating) subunit CbiE [Nitrospirota bacterium]